MGSRILKDNQKGDDEVKEESIVVSIYMFLSFSLFFYSMEPMVLRLQLIYSLLFINFSSHDNMSYKIMSAVYLTCFMHHILFNELNKIIKT